MNARICRRVSDQSVVGAELSVTLTPPPLFPPQEKLSELAAEKEDLSEKLRAEEERRKSILTDKNLVTFNRPPLISL